MPGIHGMQQQLPTATITIAPNTTNQNLPDSVFIATAGLTQGILIGKHKVLVAVQRSLSLGSWKSIDPYLPILTW